MDSVFPPIARWKYDNGGTSVAERTAIFRELNAQTIYIAYKDYLLDLHSSKMLRRADWYLATFRNNLSVPSMKVKDVPQ